MRCLLEDAAVRRWLHPQRGILQARRKPSPWCKVLGKILKMGIRGRSRV